MIFRVGDIVKVREDISTSDFYEFEKFIGVGTNEYMLEFAGKTAKIVETYDRYYSLDIDNKMWLWVDQHFEFDPIEILNKRMNNNIWV